MSSKQKNKSNKNAKVEQNASEYDIPRGPKFKARGGTAGAAGQMYESKVISLVAYRIVNDDDVKAFYLASNMGDIGDLDDVCLTFRLDDKPVSVFVQAKHVDDLSKGITEAKLYNPKDKTFYLNKYFDSYIAIRNKYEYPDGVIFDGAFKDVDFHFVIFTPVPNKIHRKKIIDENPRFNKVKQLLTVSSNGEFFKLNYDESDIQALTKPLIHKQVESIAKSFEDSVLSKSKFNDKIHTYIETYYNILVPEVLEFTEQTDGTYIATINPQLYFATDSSLIQLKEVIYRETLKRNKMNEEEIVTNLKSLLTPDISYLSKLIGHILQYDTNSNKLIIDPNAPAVVKEFGNEIANFEITESVVQAAFETAGKVKLESFKLKISASKIVEMKDSHDQKGHSSHGFTGEMLHFREMAKDYLEHLYFFTKQGKEFEVGSTLVKEIANTKQYKVKYGIQAHTFYLKYHEAIQKWWMKSGSKFYFTKEYITWMLNKIPIENYIDMLNFNCRHEIEKYAIRYSDHVIDSLKLQENVTKIINITTDSTLLTSIKLLQTYIEHGSFVNYETISNFTLEEMKIFKEELNNNVQNKVFIIIIDRVYPKYDKLLDILESTAKNLIIVSNDKVICDTNGYIVHDEHHNLVDLTDDTQIKILQYEVEVQGQTAQLSVILDEESKKVIDKDILIKIIKNEEIVIGKTLTNSKYEDIKDIYIDRTLINEKVRDAFMFYPVDTKWQYHLENFKEIENKVHIVTAKPGMGKSITLTHLSLQTKREYPHIWIVRINLLDFTDQFLQWKKTMEDQKEEQKTIDLHDTMKFILNCELSLKTSGNFNIQFNEEKIIITDCKLKGINLLHLELIVHCYNTGAIIFLFDGFDEICPNYQKQVGELINNLTKQEQEEICSTESDTCGTSSEVCSRSVEARSTGNTHQVWITSRPYESIIEYLEDMFEDVLTLQSLRRFEQDVFYIRYWNKHIMMNDLNYNQFANINSFFDYMSQFGLGINYRTKALPITCIPMKYMYSTAVEYFRTQILKAPVEVDKEELLKNWISRQLIIERHMYVDDTEPVDMVGVPLHMYITVSLFTNQINKGTPANPEDWDIERIAQSFYERYLEIKMNIQFEDITISQPKIMSIFLRERDESIDKHKKMAFYAMFRYSKKILQTFLKNDIKLVKIHVNKIQKAEERTGLVDRVKNGKPRFVHLVFAEHFCIEFISDLIKNPKMRNRMIDFTVNHLLLYGTIGLRNMFDQKIKFDPELKDVLSLGEVRHMVFDYLMKQDYEMLETRAWDVEDVGDYERTMEDALSKAINNNLCNVSMFLLSGIDVALNEDNVSDFIKFLGRGFFIGTTLTGQFDLIDLVLNRMRELSKISDVITVCKLENDLAMDSSNEDIVEALKSEAKTMSTPEYYDFGDDF